MAERHHGLHSFVADAMTDSFHDEIFAEDGFDVYVRGVSLAYGPEKAEKFRDFSHKFCFKYVQDPSSCTDSSCRFEHVSAKEIGDYIRRVIDGLEEGVPLFIPKRILMSVVSEETAMQYLSKKRPIFKKGKEFVGQETTRSDPMGRPSGVRSPPLAAQAPDRASVFPLPKSSGGIPISGVHSHDSASSNSVSFNCDTQKWEFLKGNQEFCLVVDVTHDKMETKAMCLETSPTDDTVVYSLSKCTNTPLKILIQRIFTSPVETTEVYPSAGHHFCSRALVIGASGRDEPSVAILDQGQAVAFGLPDTGSGLTIIRQGVFGEGKPLQHCVRFKVPLEGLGNFKVIGIGGESPITHICWVKVDITCEITDNDGQRKRAIFPLAFTGFLTDVANANAVLFSNKTIAALGGFVVPYDQADASRPAYCQLRLLDHKPRPLAMHPVLVHAAEQATRDPGISESLKYNLTSLLRDHKRT